jgi:hypothetical protein
MVIARGRWSEFQLVPVVREKENKRYRLKSRLTNLSKNPENK